MGLLTVGDLALRWGLSSAETVEVVREGEVPFLELKGRRRGGLNVAWNRVRFDEDAVREWEARNARKFRGPKKPQPAGQPKPASSPAPRRLGNWK